MRPLGLGAREVGSLRFSDAHIISLNVVRYKSGRSLALFKIEAPLAEEIFGMRVRWGKKTFTPYAIVHLPG